MMTPIRTILFDLGGTLIHYHDPHNDDQQRRFRRVTHLGIRAVYERLAADGYDLSSADHLQDIMDEHIGQAMQEVRETLRGTTVETPIRAAFAEMGADLTDDEWTVLRPLFYEPIHATVFPREGLVYTLEALASKGYILGLISNTLWAADFHDQHLAEHHILHYLGLRIYSCDMPYVKPHPAIFKAALDQMGAESHESVYIGDQPDWDVAGAHNAGMRAVLIRSPYVTLTADDPEPDAIIDELPDLIGLLEKWHGES